MTQTKRTAQRRTQNRTKKKGTVMNSIKTIFATVFKFALDNLDAANARSYRALIGDTRGKRPAPTPARRPRPVRSCAA
jgi:hypothetical protein